MQGLLHTQLLVRGERVVFSGPIMNTNIINLNQIRIQMIFGFGKSCKYEYKHIRLLKIIQIRIVFGLKISAKYEYVYHYSVSTI